MPYSSGESFLWQPTKTELADYLALAETFYVFHAERLKQNCRRFQSAFQQHYPNTRLAYSVKTNYLPAAIMETVGLGWYSEVVSGLEYDLVKSLNIAGENIIFNGPLKTSRELHIAITDGAVINVDSVEELQLIAEIAQSLKTIAKLGVRLNFPETLDCESRFGFTANQTAQESIQKILDSQYLELEGLHTHYCFEGKDPNQYTKLVCAIISFIDNASPNLWQSIKTLNFGGGFFSPMPEKMAKNWQRNIPSYEDYAKAIVVPLNQRLQKDNLVAPQLVLEPGLAVVADAMSFVCRVDAIKTDSKPATAITNGSIYNIKPTKSSINLPWTQYRFGSDHQMLKGTVSGYTCMEDDVLDADFDGEIAQGDVFVFGNVGAYTIVLQPSFIRLAPAVLAYEGDAVVTLVKEQSNSDFIKSRFGLSNHAIRH